MDQWKPDLQFIDKIGKILEGHGVLDKPYALSQEGKTVGDMIRFVEGDTDKALPEILDYIRKKFSLEDKLCDHHLTGQETIDAMKQGTPYGIIMYRVLLLGQF